MATKSNIRILWEDETNLGNYIRIPLAANEAVAVGDLVDITAYGTNTCGPSDAAQSELFAGISKSVTSTETDDVNICVHCVIAGKTSSAFTHAGEGAAWSAGDNGTDWTFAPSTEADIIGWSLEAIASGSTGKILIDVRELKTLTSGDATALGLFRSGEQA